MQLTRAEIKSVGADVVAVSPQLPERSSATAQQHAVEFDILSDVGNGLARRLGLVFTMPEKYREGAKKFGIDLLAINGDETFELPLTATYLIGMDGIIVHAFIDSDYTKRMEPKEIVQLLRK